MKCKLIMIKSENRRAPPPIEHCHSNAWVELGFPQQLELSRDEVPVGLQKLLNLKHPEILILSTQ